MRRGDRVIVTNTPLLWGIGRIHHADKRGLLCVEFEGPTEHQPNVFELFHPAELEPADRWVDVAAVA